MAGPPIDKSGRRKAMILRAEAGPAMFAKFSEGPSAGERMQCEARALRTLAGVPGVRTPDVIGVAESTDSAALVMRAVDPVDETDTHWSQLGLMVAALHACTDDRVGLEYDNFIGDFPQANTDREMQWPAFFRQYRGLPMLERASEMGLLTAAEDARIRDVLYQAESIAGDSVTRFSLLHGDLWKENAIAGAQGPLLIDPAISFGNREMDLAFGKMAPHVLFPDPFYEAYEAAMPLENGYEHREGLWQLWPLLTHIVQDGRTWVPRTMEAIAHY